MNKKLIVILIINIITLTCYAQSIKMIEPDFKDYKGILHAAGYDVYTFDISNLKDTTYTITFELKEYVSDSKEPVNTRLLSSFRNRSMVSDFMWKERSREEFEKIKQDAIDFENGVYSRSDKITLGFIPLSNDSTKNLVIIMENGGSRIYPLDMKKATKGTKVIPAYFYGNKPFKVYDFKNDTFIPLVLYGSYWYDDKINSFRFCGEDEIEPNMKSEILTHIPHYYVIGVTFSPVN